MGTDDMYRRILLAYDGSREGALALREGALLAKACCSEIVLLSVVPESAGVVTVEAIQGGVVSSLTESYGEFLQRAINRLKQLGFPNVTGKLVVGEPAPTIGQVARDMAADLVVVGHKHQDFLSRWWSGSNDAYLTEHIHCSLVLCRNEITDEAFVASLGATETAPA